MIEFEKFYPTEVDRNEKMCSKVNERRTDGRYTKAGRFQVSEYDLQVNSGVKEILTNLPQSSMYIGNFEDKKRQMLNFYTRPTINWSLKCELENKRELVFELAQQAEENSSVAKLGPTRIIDYAFICSLVMIPFGVFALCAGAVKFTHIANGFAFLASLICFLALTLLTLPILIMSGQIEHNFDAAYLAATRLNEELVGCADPETVIDMFTYEYVGKKTIITFGTYEERT